LFCSSRRDLKDGGGIQEARYELACRRVGVAKFSERKYL